MENLNNENYGRVDPDFIDQNTPVNNDSNSFYDDEKLFQHNYEENDYGVHDNDFVEQNISVENEVNEIYEENPDQFKYQEEFVADLNHETNDYNRNETLRAENIPNEERIVNEDGMITNDNEESDLNNDNDSDVGYNDDDLEKDGDLDDDEELSDFDAEHFPETHPRE